MESGHKKVEWRAQLPWNESTGKIAKENIYVLSLVWPGKLGAHKTGPWWQDIGHVVFWGFFQYYFLISKQNPGRM